VRLTPKAPAMPSSDGKDVPGVSVAQRSRNRLCAARNRSSVRDMRPPGANPQIPAIGWTQP